MTNDLFPELGTERLILRKMSPDDRDDFFAIRSDARMHTYTDTMPDREISQTDTYLANMLQGIAEDRWIVWAIQPRDLNRVIGSAGIWNFDEKRTTVELSYGIAPEYQGQGYIKEALARIIDFAFQTLHLTTIEAYTEAENVPSRKLLERLRFEESGRTDDISADGSRVYHMILYKRMNPNKENALFEL